MNLEAMKGRGVPQKTAQKPAADSKKLHITFVSKGNGRLIRFAGLVGMTARGELLFPSPDAGIFEKKLSARE